MANDRSSFGGRMGSRLSALFTGETKGIRQERAIADFTAFKEAYEHFLGYILEDECYIDSTYGVSAKAAKSYLERVRYARGSIAEQTAAENYLEYIKEQIITDIITEILYRNGAYSLKASGRQIPQVLRLDYEKCTHIANKYRGTSYQINNGNPISNATEFKRAYEQAVDYIYGTQHSGDFGTNRANDIAAGIPRK